MCTAVICVKSVSSIYPWVLFWLCINFGCVYNDMVTSCAALYHITRIFAYNIYIYIIWFSIILAVMSMLQYM